MIKHKLLPVALVVIAMSLLSACATQRPAAPKEERAASDPWEPFNRRVTAFNDNVDKVTLKPLAKAYQAVLPDFVETGIHNVFSNLRGPLHIVNNLLQGKLKRSGRETGRLLVNSILGLGGLLDVGTNIGWEAAPEDFGQTLAVWGVGDGPYLVLPFLGPNTLRDAFAIPLDSAADPVYYLEPDSHRYGVVALRLIDMRARLFTAEALIEDSFDRYLSIRESYLQNRRFQVYDGDPPEDEDFYDDIFDEEFEEDQ